MGEDAEGGTAEDVGGGGEGGGECFDVVEEGWRD